MGNTCKVQKRRHRAAQANSSQFPRLHWIFGLSLAGILFGLYVSFFGEDTPPATAQLPERPTQASIQFSYIKRDGSTAFPEKSHPAPTDHFAASQNQYPIDAPPSTNVSDSENTEPTANTRTVASYTKPPMEMHTLKPQSTATDSSQISGTSNTLIQSTVKPGDSLYKIFARLGLSKNTLEKIVASYDDPSSPLKQIYPGQIIDFEIKPDSNILHSFAFNKDKLTKVVISRDDQGNFSIHERSRTLAIDTRFAQGMIKGAFYTAAKDAGLSDKTILEFADIFAWDVDFSLDIRQNDRFEVYYERNHLDDGSIQPGRILAARFKNRGQWITAIAFTDPAGHTCYYTPEGNNVRKAFLRSPVDFARISSRFNLNRKHPVLHTIRAHKGVDYAAKRGTPIKATGDGKVLFKGRKGGYGRVVILQHGQKYSTLYAHLQGYAKSLTTGKKVKQGEVIGFIGSSGLATGPHLHYEFRANNVHKNPLTVKFPDAAPIAKEYRANFEAITADRLNLMAKYKQQSLARADDANVLPEG
jgi:murein DD-endopeptidase MepM/ murein hydrolase activator NlpD